jgi:enoyl-CoA hydratase/carnithine racemase
MSKLLITHEERVLRLTLNNPEKRNVLDEGLCRDLVAALKDAGRDRTVGCVLLDAAGPAFCAGVDLDDALLPDAPERTEVHEQLFTFGVHYHKPIVAAVHGPAYGAGVGLIANCQVVLAAQGATFALTEIRYGHWPFVTHRAIALAIGERRTVELSLTGRLFSTAEAREYGLVHEVTPAFELQDRAAATAANLANASQETLRRGLDFVQKSREMSWETAGRLAAEYSERTFRSADYIEGIRALRETRKPAWPSLNLK